MLRQFLTTDANAINAAIRAYRSGSGPRVVARLRPGAKPVEIDAARTIERSSLPGIEALPGFEKSVFSTRCLQVRTAAGEWHEAFACYKELPDVG